jgi:hypothetical protein
MDDRRAGLIGARGATDFQEYRPVFDNPAVPPFVVEVRR